MQPSRKASIDAEPSTEVRLYCLCMNFVPGIIGLIYSAHVYNLGAQGYHASILSIRSSSPVTFPSHMETHSKIGQCLKIKMLSTVLKATFSLRQDAFLWKWC